MPSSLAAPALTLPFVLGGSADRFLDIALKAAERRHTVRTLLAPQLLAQHGKTAQLLEGQRVPIESTAEETHDGKTKNVRSASYKEVGMQLKVTPRVLPDHDRVQLEVLVENSQLAHGSTSASYPTITTSQIKNTVVLRSGQTVILGGLVRRVEKRERSGVPYLSRIPLLGWLFSGFSTVHEEQRLYVVLHTRLAPHSGAQ
jgi:general secretion pathway protein D